MSVTDMNYMKMDEVGGRCLAYLEAALRDALKGEMPALAVARLSTALGIVESSLAVKDESQQRWPENLPQQVEACLEAVQRFAAEVHLRLPSAPDARSKAKIVADAVWDKLTGSFSKDLLHAQHIYHFARLLLPGGGGSGKRQLDCAGVTTTTYAVCMELAHKHGHLDLQQLRFLVCEDHCLLSLDPASGRNSSIEVTADTAAKRGLPAAPELWQGWLYAGGHAVACTPQQVVAALVTSVNPVISGRKKGTDSEQLQSVQKALLTVLHAKFPAAMYPAATCALADLKEIEEQDAIEAAVAAGDAAAVEQLLRRGEGDAQALFEAAIEAANDSSSGVHGANGSVGACSGIQGRGWQWYPYSYIVAFLCRRAELLETCAAAFPEQAEQYGQRAVAVLREALRWAASGSDVLAKYRFHPGDDQLYKDVGEGTLEYCTDGLAAYSIRFLGRQIDDASLLAPLLTFLDGICVLFTGKPKPAAWANMVMRTAKLFTAQAREEAAAAATARSEPMQKARRLWAALKLAVLRGLFEAADIAGSAERGSKRQRVRV